MKARMQPKRYPGRYLHLIRLWQDYVNQSPMPQMDRWLARTFQKNKSFGKKDRLFYTDLLFAGIRFGYLALFLETGWTMRQGSTIKGMWSSWLQRFLHKVPNSDGMAPALKQIQPAAFFAWIELLRHCQPGVSSKRPDPLNLTDDETERWNFAWDVLAHLDAQDDLTASLLRASCPLWYEDAMKTRVLRSQWSIAQTSAWLAAQSRKPPLWIRVHHPSQVAAVMDDLKQAEFQILQQQNLALAIAGDRPIYELDTYRQGLFEIQDWASQQIGLAVAAEPGQSIWDMCAGGGGKTMQLAAMLEGKGAVHASEIRDYKLKDLKERAKRAGFFHIQTYPWDGGKIPNFSGQKNRMMDAVLVDAPCSGSGTWRRNPDAKYRPYDDSLSTLCQLQERLLSLGATRVKSGGKLVYATCSWLVAENEAVVERFLTRHPGFKLQTLKLLGCPEVDADTMFVAVLVNQPL